MGEVIQTEIWTSRFDLGDFRVRGPADPFVEAMGRAESACDRLVLATRALRRDPDCIEALLVVAANCRDQERRILYLNLAVEAGSVHWDADDIREVVDRGYAAISGARAWMQAIKDLGDAYAEAGEPDDAQDCYERLLALDISDALGAKIALEGLRGSAPQM